MKSVIILTLATISIGVFAQHQGGPPPSEEERETMRRLENCSKQTGVNPSMLTPEKMAQANVEQEIKCFHACMSKEAGMMNADGTINKAELLNFPPDMPQDFREHLTNARTPCLDLKGDDECETAFLLFKCLTEPPQGSGQ